MKRSITENLTLIERSVHGKYSKYIPSYFISTNLFEAAIKRLGGYIYNMSVGKIGEVTIFNGFTWISVSGVDSYDEADAWAKKLEETIFDGITISPVYVHHPDGHHAWGVEFNRERPYWESSAETFVAEARKLLIGNDKWFYQCGSDSPDKGYQFFELLGVSSKYCFAESEEMSARAASIQIANELGTLAFL